MRPVEMHSTIGYVFLYRNPLDLQKTSYSKTFKAEKSNKVILGGLTEGSHH